MILQSEIREKARKYGVPVSTIERDYVQNWLLKFLSSIDMVLKGGTGIRKVYIGEYRFSDDLDFTLLSEISGRKLKVMVKSSVEMVMEESGISFNDDIRFKENENGFEMNVYFQVMQRGNNITKIKIDITKLENEKLLLPINTKAIIHPYSDALESKVRIYSLEEIMAEKMRSLFERTRPRDLYDVWYLWNRVDRRKVLSIFPQKCKSKNVIIDIKNFESRKGDFMSAWESSLGHQLKQLPNFNEVFSIVHKELRKID